jgi:hypothetical protein
MSHLPPAALGPRPFQFRERRPADHDLPDPDDLLPGVGIKPGVDRERADRDFYAHLSPDTF